jgi:hypothetical protein
MGDKLHPNSKDIIEQLEKIIEDIKKEDYRYFFCSYFGGGDGSTNVISIGNSNPVEVIGAVNLSLMNFCNKILSGNKGGNDVH